MDFLCRAPANSRAAPAARTPAPVMLRRDPCCGTYVSPEISFALEQAGQIEHFCSADMPRPLLEVRRSFARAASTTHARQDKRVIAGGGRPMASADKAVPQPIVPRMAPREDLNPYRIAQMQFDMAAEFLKLDPGLRQILRTPRRVMEVAIPVKLDNGQVKVFHGLSRAAQHRARSGERRHPLPSQSHAGRSEGAGVVDDLEDGDGEHSLWRREGRRHLRSETDVARGTGAHDAAVRLRNYADPRAGEGYSRAGRVHRCADDGLDHGHVCDDGRQCVAGVRDGQAGVAGRLGRTQRRHGARAACS